MYFDKKLKNADKEIVADKNYILDSDGDAIISVKASESDDIYSEYNFEANDQINPELADFIWSKARFIPRKCDIKLKIYTEKDANKDEISNAIRNHYKKEYVDVKSQIRSNLIQSLILFLIGAFFVGLWTVMFYCVHNDFLEFITEIISWGFLWGSIESFFFERIALKFKKTMTLKIYCAEIEIIKLKNIKKLDE